jgi:hypothetical protein
MTNIETIEDFIKWLEEIDSSLDEDTTNNKLNRTGDVNPVDTPEDDVNPVDTPEDDVQPVQDLALTIVNNELLKCARGSRLPSEADARIIVMLYNIAKDNT